MSINITTTATVEQLAGDIAYISLGAADYLDALKQAHQEWEAGLLRSSNEGLYALLAKCLRVYEIMSEDSPRGTKLREEFDAYIKAAKLKFSGDTHTANKIARIVFDTDRKRASAYGVVLRLAIAEGKTHADLPAFIRNAGGIEKLRLTQTANGNSQRESTEDKAARVWETVKATALATAAGKGLKEGSDHANIGKRVVLLATQQANGDYTVHAVIKADGVVNTAFAAHGSALANTAKNVTAEQQIAEKQSNREQLRREAAAAALAA